jgi:hypothetical protein
MEKTVEIRFEFDDVEEEGVESLIEFFTPIAFVHVNQTESKAVKSWDRVIEIVLTVFGSWATEKFVLDPLAKKAGEWLKGINKFWEKADYHHKVNVIIKFQQEDGNLEIKFCGVHESEILREVWQTAIDVIELVQAQSIQLDEVRITSNPNNGLFVIGYVSNKPKHIINLCKKDITQITKSLSQDLVESDPEFQHWYIAQLQKRLEYLNFIKQKGYDVPESEIKSLIEDIQRLKDEFIK